jgi:competence protein ComEC
MFQKARGEVQVRSPQSEAQPRYGERWRLRGVLIDNYLYPDSSRTEASERIIPQRFLFYADNQSVPVLLTPASQWSFLHWCFFIREKCSVALSRGIEHRPDAIAILQALVLGRQHELPLEMREAFVATGTYHIFAISGQHVAIIALFIVFVLQIYGIGRMNWFYYLMPVLVVFTVMTGMSASAVRGCIMALMCFLGPLFKRKTDISSAMALAALLIVGADPLQLFQAGFLLSFGIVAGLIVLCPPLIEMSERHLAPDPWRIEPENWPARNARKAIRWVLFMLIASFAACLVSTPLIARWFNLVSPVALLANLLVIPLATFVLLAGCLSIVFGWCWPLVA